jgi:hypothetical protein
MSPTVDEFRNEIRVAVGRYQRIESTGFTKEALAAICDAVGADIETEPIPAKSEMRVGIRRAVGLDDPGDADRAFRKADLEAIAAALRDDG